MRKFKVICLNVGGHSNKIFYHEQVVNEDQFLPGQADKYVASNHIEEVKGEEDEPTPAVEIPVTDSPAKEAEEKTEPKHKKKK